MKKLYKNNYGVASPLEFTIASVALISTLAVVVASMSPPVEQASAQLYADANAKATEIMSLLLTSNSEVGLAIDPGTSVPVPPTKSITDITINNSAPSVDTPYPGHKTTVPSPVTLSVVIHDADVDPQDEIFVSFYNASNGECLGTDSDLDGNPVTCDWGALTEGVEYSWYVNVTDGTDNVTSLTWNFTIMISNSPPTLTNPGVAPPTGTTSTVFIYRVTYTDPDDDPAVLSRVCIDSTFYNMVPLGMGEPSLGIIYVKGGVTLGVGTHSYYFIFNDGHGHQVRSPPSGSWPGPVVTGTGPLVPCFLAGTQILMADGSQKNIEDTHIGDMVISYDEKTGTLQKDKVIDIYHDTPEQMISDYYLIVNKNLKVTPDHQLYVNNQWIKAEDLKIGDQLFKGEVSSLEKIYEKVPSYNFETEKYHTYLVIFGDNIVIAHNRQKYILAGNEEEISLARQSSVTENDYTALLSMDKIFRLSEMPYKELKEILCIPDEYEFYITIGNSDSIFLNYVPDSSITLDSASVVVTCRENAIIVDSVGYAYVTIAVTVVK